MNITINAKKKKHNRIKKQQEVTGSALYGSEAGAGSARLIVTCLLIAVVGIVLYKMISPKNTPAPEVASQAEVSHEATSPQETVVAEQTEAELEELAKQEKVAQLEQVQQFVTTWQEAWQNSAGANGDTDSYMNLYSEDFKAKGFDKKGWRTAKAERNMKKAWIKIEIADLKVVELPDGIHYQAEFTQTYSSSNYSDTGTKVLTIRKDEESYKIITEQ